MSFGTIWSSGNVQHQLFCIWQTLRISIPTFLFVKGFLHRGKIVVKNGVTLSFFNWIAKARGHWDFLQQMKISFEIALAHFSSRLISVISMINAICLVICIRFEPCEGNSRLTFNIPSLKNIDFIWARVIRLFFKWLFRHQLLTLDTSY